MEEGSEYPICLVNHVPEDIWEYILSFLTVAERSKTSVVCKLWQQR